MLITTAGLILAITGAGLRGGGFSSSSQRPIARRIGQGISPQVVPPPGPQLPPLEVGRALVPPQLPGPCPPNHPTVRPPPRGPGAEYSGNRAPRLWAMLPWEVLGRGGPGVPSRTRRVPTALGTCPLPQPREAAGRGPTSPPWCSRTPLVMEGGDAEAGGKGNWGDPLWAVWPF